jgi:RDD family
MICAFCGSRNSEGEHRCRRCGRRPDDTLTSDYMHRTEGQLAVKMQPVRVPDDEAPRRRNLTRAVQVPLFQDRPAPNVIPFEAYAPVEPLPKPRQRSAAPRPPRRAPRVPEEQGALDFLPPAPPKPRTLPTTVEAQIYCDAPVATRLHRAVAAGLDASIVVIAYGLFLLVYFLCGGGFSLERTCILMLAAPLPLLGMVYGLMWCWVGRESAGLQWTRLRLLTFEGFPPDRKQRMWRFAGSCLSVFTLLGLAWSALDEESLGWQDHISRTFPTPIALDEQVLRRL